MFIIKVNPLWTETIKVYNITDIACVICYFFLAAEL